MKRKISIITAIILSQIAISQNHNDENIHEHINLLKEKSDKFNVYLNTQTALEISNVNEKKEYASAFKFNELKLEFRGNLTDKIFYILRHNLNRNTRAASLDNISKATDMMYVGFRINDKVSISAGKLGVMWGGFEYDKNPIFIYEFSDFINYISAYMVGGVLTYMPNEKHEFNLNITNSRNNKISEDYLPIEGLEDSNMPLAYIFNWNGNLLDNKLQTRWAIGYQQEAKKHSTKMITLGTKLNLPKIQMFLDYLRSNEDLDKLQYAKVVGSDRALKDVVYNTFIYQADYQPNEKWNIFMKGTYETTKVGNVPVGGIDTRRKSYGYSAGVEFLPFRDQDLRFFFTYIGRKYVYKHSLLDYNTNRLMLGMIYRLKAF